MAEVTTEVAFLPLGAVFMDVPILMAPHAECEVAVATQVASLPTGGTALPLWAVIVGVPCHHLAFFIAGDLVEGMRFQHQQSPLALLYSSVGSMHTVMGPS